MHSYQIYCKNNISPLIYRLFDFCWIFLLFLPLSYSLSSLSSLWPLFLPPWSVPLDLPLPWSLSLEITTWILKVVSLEESVFLSILSSWNRRNPINSSTSIIPKFSASLIVFSYNWGCLELRRLDLRVSFSSWTYWKPWKLIMWCTSCIYSWWSNNSLNKLSYSWHLLHQKEHVHSLEVDTRPRLGRIFLYIIAKTGIYSCICILWHMRCTTRIW